MFVYFSFSLRYVLCTHSQRHRTYKPCPGPRGALRITAKAHVNVTRCLSARAGARNKKNRSMSLFSIACECVVHIKLNCLLAGWCKCRLTDPTETELHPRHTHTHTQHTCRTPAKQSHTPGRETHRERHLTPDTYQKSRTANEG